MKPQTLHVRVGEDLAHSLARTVQNLIVAPFADITMDVRLLQRQAA